MSNLYRGPSKDAPYQVSIHLAKRFQRRRFFRNQPIRNKNGLWRIFPRSIDKHGCHRQFLFLIGRFLKIFSETAWPNEPILGRMHLWRSSKDYSFSPAKFRYIWQTSFRGEEFFKSANQKQESPVVAMFVNG
jgi:hypothetical protein